MRLAYDFETDGLFADSIRPGTKNPTIISRVHCLVMQDVDTGEVRAWYKHLDVAGAHYSPPPSGDLAEGVAFLLTAARRYAHNGLEYDERVIREFFPAQWSARGPGAFRDSQVGAAAVWPTEHLRRLDAARVAKAKAAGRAPFPGDLVGRHSLKAWGIRFGNRKAEYDGGFARFTPEMLAYCVQDVSTLVTLVKKLERRVADGRFSDRAWELEQDFKLEIARQMANGFKFDVPAAERLAAELQGKRAEILADLAAAVPPFHNTRMTDAGVLSRQRSLVAGWEVKVAAAKTPGKRRAAVASLEKAQAALAVKIKPKVELVTFNPGSRHHIARHLMERHGWKPTKFTEGEGDVQVDEAVLKSIAHLPDVPKILEFLLVNKRLGQMAESRNKEGKPWLKCVAADGRIHGRVDHNGAVTGRCTHSAPNMSAVPKVGKPWGRECRALFTCDEGNLLVGGDVKALEPRFLGHYLQPYDGGEFIARVLDGTLYEKVQALLGIPDGPLARDTAKRAFLAILYGAWVDKVGLILGVPFQKAKAARSAVINGIPGLADFKAKCESLAKSRGSLRMPDGRLTPTRSPHAALNTALQGSGAVLVKLATVLMHRRFREEGLAARQVHTAHDEVELEVPAAQATRVAEILAASVVEAGERFKLRIPMKADVKVGRTWADVH